MDYKGFMNLEIDLVARPKMQRHRRICHNTVVSANEPPTH